MLWFEQSCNNKIYDDCEAFMNPISNKKDNNNNNIEEEDEQKDNNNDNIDEENTTSTNENKTEQTGLLENGNKN